MGHSVKGLLVERRAEYGGSFSGMFGFGVWLREVGVVLFEHLVLVAVAELGRERIGLEAAFAIWAVFFGAFTECFVREGCY
jgi:hypothetical protein